MRRIVMAVLVLAGLSLTGVAQAQVPPGYMTVDAVSLGVGQLTVRGVKSGEAAPTTVTVSFTLGDRAVQTEQCLRLLTLALSKPGQYVARAGSNVCEVAILVP